MGKILVLDDERSSREYLVAVLARAGYEVVQVASAHAGLVVLRAEPIDLVITDMVMPGVNGYEFARTVQEDPTLAHTPLIFCTAKFNDADARDLAKSLKVQDLLVKPCSPATILDAVRRRLCGVLSESDQPSLSNQAAVSRAAENQDENGAVSPLLARSEQRLRALLDHAPVAIALKDLNGRFLICNGRALQIIGRSEEEVLGRTTTEMFPAAANEESNLADREALSTRQLIESENRVESRDGMRDLLTARFPLLDEAGEPYGLGIITTDVTLRRQAERRLIENAAKLENDARQQACLAEISYQGLAHIGTHHLLQKAAGLLGSTLQAGFCRVQEIGPAGDLRQIAVYGVATEAATGPGRVFPVSAAKFAVLIRSTMVSNNLAEESRFQGMEISNGWGFGSVVGLCIETRQGPVATIEIFQSQTNAFQPAHVEFCQSAANIISAAIERDRAEDNLKATQGHLSHLITSSPAVIYALRLQGETLTPITVGENIVRVTGYRVEEVLRPDWWREHSQCHSVMEAVTDGHLNGDHFVREYQLCCADNRLIWVRDECRFLFGSAETPVEIVGSLSDVTQQKALEDRLQRSQKMEIMGQLAGGISHDFNNLLTVISGFALLELEDPAIAPGARRALETIATAAESAMGLTRQLLSFSRKSLSQFRLLDLGTALGNVTRMLGRVISTDIELKVNIEPDIPPVSADLGMIEQIILNLALNARDAMPYGGKLSIDVRHVLLTAEQISARAKPCPAQAVCIEVRDSGLGMAPEIANRIFEPFFTTKEPGKGTGLGLATVHTIVERHAGWIDLETEPSAGTVFRVYLPAAEGTPEVQEREAASQASRRPRATILLVEENLMVRSFVETFLQRRGYNVLVCCDADHAELVFRKAGMKVHLLIMSLNFPGGRSGPGLATELKELRPSLRVLYTAGSQTLDLERLGLTEGVNLLVKPFQLNRLEKIVARLLDSASHGDLA